MIQSKKKPLTLLSIVTLVAVFLTLLFITSKTAVAAPSYSTSVSLNAKGDPVAIRVKPHPHTTSSNISAPSWVKIERKANGEFAYFTAGANVGNSKRTGTVKITDPTGAKYTYYITQNPTYEKLGDVRDPDSGKTYSVWMISDGYLAAFNQSHSGFIVRIIDGQTKTGKPDYQIQNSWSYRNKQFKTGVCNLIITYNKANNRTAQWNRNINQLVDEWTQHNLAYCFCNVATTWSNLQLTCSQYGVSYPVLKEAASHAQHVDLDADGHLYFDPVSVIVIRALTIAAGIS